MEQNTLIKLDVWMIFFSFEILLNLNKIFRKTEKRNSFEIEVENRNATMIIITFPFEISFEFDSIIITIRMSRDSIDFRDGISFVTKIEPRSSPK